MCRFQFSFLRSRSVTLPGLSNTMEVPSSGILCPFPAEAKISKQRSRAPPRSLHDAHPFIQSRGLSRAKGVRRPLQPRVPSREAYFLLSLPFQPLSSFLPLFSFFLFFFFLFLVSLFLKETLPRASQCTPPFSIDDDVKEVADISCSCIIITHKVEIAGSASLGLGNEAASWNFVNAGKSRMPAGNLWRDLSPLYSTIILSTRITKRGSLWVEQQETGGECCAQRCSFPTGREIFLPRRKKKEKKRK